LKHTPYTTKTTRLKAHGVSLKDESLKRIVRTSRQRVKTTRACQFGSFISNGYLYLPITEVFERLAPKTVHMHAARVATGWRR